MYKDIFYENEVNDAYSILANKNLHKFVDIVLNKICVQQEGATTGKYEEYTSQHGNNFYSPYM